MKRVRKDGMKVATLHLQHLNPFPANFGDVLLKYKKILVPEVNSGQLRHLIRAEYLIPAIGLNQVTGFPFKVSAVERKIRELLA